ncbi:MAG: isoprenylcysteine carboxylmethyltransferase family protein [Chloroflexota bacterium]
MQLKGMDQLRKHVPDVRSPGGVVRVVLYLLAWVFLVTYYFLTTDQIPTWSIDSQIIIMALGFLLLSMFFSQRKVYKEKYGKLAYRNAFAHFAVPGLGSIFAAIAHAGYMNGPRVPQGWWNMAFDILGWFLLITGLVLWIRSVLTFGVGNLAMLYVYHPEEGKIVNSAIYNVLRHPIYAGALRVGLGLALINGNANSLAFALLMPLGFFGWIRLVEEKELIDRFGQSYVEYRKRVPAFWPKPGGLGAYFKFLIRGS